MLRWKANILNGQGEGNSIFPLSGKKVLNTSSDLCACTCTSVVSFFFFFFWNFHFAVIVLRLILYFIIGVIFLSMLWMPQN